MENNIFGPQLQGLRPNYKFKFMGYDFLSTPESIGLIGVNVQSEIHLYCLSIQEDCEIIYEEIS